MLTEQQQLKSMSKVARAYRIGSVVGWYNMAGEQKFGIVRSYTFNSIKEVCIEVELVVGISDAKIFVSLHPDNATLQIFKV